MQAGQPCQKVQLAGQEGLSVTLCHQHQTIELSIGAVQLRLDIASIEALQTVINEAMDNLMALHRVEQMQYALMQRLKKAH